MTPVTGATPVPTDVLAIDIGGSSIKAARYDRRGRVLEARRVPTPPPARLAGEVSDLAGRLCGPATAAVGVVTPGVIEDGVLRYATNLGVRDLPLRELVSRTVALPTVLGQDVAAAALAESDALGSDLLFLGLGTGIAAGLVIDGRVWRGASGMAGEIGHSCVVAGGEPCACGQLGCLEVYASAAGISRRYAGASGATGLDAAAVVSRVATDPVAARVWAEAVEAIAHALAAAVLLVDPAVVVLGGGLAEAGAALLDPVRAGLRARLRWRSPPQVRPALLGVDAGRAGAALLAWQLLSEREGTRAVTGQATEASSRAAAETPSRAAADRYEKGAVR